LTLLGFSSTLLIIFTLVFVRAYYGELDDVDLENIIGPNVALSMGIFVLSLGGHASLPPIYREMRKPEEFNRMLDVCFFIMFVSYAGTGLVGYSIYGANSNVIISTNLLSNPGGVLAKVTAGFIIAKNYLQMNPLVAVLCDNTEFMMGIEEDPLKQRIYRTVMFLITSIIAFLAHDSVPFMEGITGGTSTMITTFILPAILFYYLHKEKSSKVLKMVSLFIFIFGCVMMVVLTYGAVLSLVH